MKITAVTGSKIAAIVIVAVGIGLRFINLGKKPYWMDETATSLRVSGYRPSEVKNEAFNGRDVSVADLKKYQHINPDRGLHYTVLSLIASDPEHPPLYFLMVRLW